MSPAPGTPVGLYEIVRPLGAGGPVSPECDLRSQRFALNVLNERNAQLLTLVTNWTTAAGK